MALTNLPEIFSKLYKENYQANLVFGAMTNKDYEGEVVGGKAVKITSFSDVEINDYTPGQDLPALQDVGNGQLSLLIDQFKAFNFYVDSIEKVQRDPKLVARHMRNAAIQVAKAQDQFIAGLYTQAHADNFIGTDAAPIDAATPDDAYQLLVDLAQKLDEKDVPDFDRHVAVNPQFMALLRKSNYFTKSSDGVVVNGIIGEAAGFTVHRTTLTPDVAGATPNSKIIAAHLGAITFASQLEEIEQFKPERRFGDGVKGLQVYGAKVIRPEALAILSLKK